MIGVIQIGMVVQMFLVGAGRNAGEFINIEKLSDRVVLAYWVGTDRRCNLTAIKSQKGLVLVDSEMSPRIMAPIKKRLERIFGRNDWVYVINTHAHDNHAGGNVLFPGATIVGHDNLAEDMQWLIRRQTEPDWKRRELDRADQLMRNLQGFLPQVARNPAQTKLVWGEIKFWELHTQDLREGYEIVKPSLTFADKHTIDLGDLRLELVYFGKGHSTSDILIYVPQERLLVSGAVVYQRAHIPAIGEETRLEDIHRFLAVLDQFLADDVKIDHVVPGHSPVLVKNDLAPVRDYYQRMLTGVRAAQQEGLTLEQTTKRLAVRTNFPALREAPPGAWSHGMHERNLKNLWRLVKEERQPPRTGPGKDENLAPAPIVDRK
ncbi:MAG: MBL fold metallo-hydrolase [Phycisphaerae bacterium]|nr:MBL fold metallo-hydrolase [Phycisphaerae bacterium]